MLINVRGRQAYAYTVGRNPAAGQRHLVFIHGAAQDHSLWALQSRYLAHHCFNVLAFDLPGHGRSEGEALSSVEALADWLADALACAGVEKATLIGHSLGSLVALEAASRLPYLAEKLVLVGASIPMAVSDALLAAAREDTPAAIRMISQWSHAPANLLGGNAVPGFWLPGGNNALMARAKPQVLHRDLLNCRDYTNGLAAAAQVTCPTLLLSGTRDLMTPPKSAQPLQEALRDARRILIEGAGHAVLLERPDECLSALRGFLKT